MKPRHAAALALVGWYLMVPPTTIIPNGHTGYEEEIPPISRDWEVVRRYTTAEQCADELRFMLSHFDSVAKFAKQRHQNAGSVQAQLIYGGACFRDDDPRLKEK